MTKLEEILQLNPGVSAGALIFGNCPGQYLDKHWRYRPGTCAKNNKRFDCDKCWNSPSEED